MRSEVDENLPIEVTELLRQHRYDAHSVPEEQLTWHPDLHVASVCRDERRTLVTLDLDFSDIRNYPPEDYHGIIILRRAVQNITSLIRLMGRPLPKIPRTA
jgi:predicted nuclease of predicted toxin-antitoxin system